MHPQIKETIEACLKFEPMERPSVSELLRFKILGLAARSGSSFKLKRESLSQSRVNGYNKNIPKQPFMKNMEKMKMEPREQVSKFKKDVQIRTNHTSKKTLKSEDCESK